MARRNAAKKYGIACVCMWRGGDARAPVDWGPCPSARLNWVKIREGGLITTMYRVQLRQPIDSYPEYDDAGSAFHGPASRRN